MIRFPFETSRVQNARRTLIIKAPTLIKVQNSNLPDFQLLCGEPGGGARAAVAAGLPVGNVSRAARCPLPARGVRLLLHRAVLAGAAGGPRPADHRVSAQPTRRYELSMPSLLVELRERDEKQHLFLSF